MLRIIARLWSAVFDLLMYIRGNGYKTIDQIEDDLREIEILCGPYAEDVEIGETQQKGGDGDGA